MPELPEVESVRRTLEPLLLHIPITSIQVLRKDFLTPQSAPIQNLLQHPITRTLRHGKKLFLVADDNQTLVLHLGMSGRVDCVPSTTPILIHTHIILHLQDHSDVRLRDPRRFGGLWYYPTFDAAFAKETKHLGKDALTITAQDLAIGGGWQKSRARLKQRLLSQKDIAGLGNIYVDEALWQSKLHPRQRLDRIRPDQLQLLVKAIHAILHKSIHSGGTTLRDYRNVSDQPGQFARRLLAYGRAGKPCKRCGTLLKSTLIAARTTVFCPTCQKLR